ncbi:MAG TPA: hypothetical protein VGG32_08575 [Thermoplasmata archaeon]|jgi:hypothetical protein
MAKNVVPAGTAVVPSNVEKALDLIPWASEDEAVERIALRVLDAKSVREALSLPEESIGLRRTMVDKQFRIDSVSWLPSTIENQPFGRYALIEGVTKDGEVVVGTIGGLNVMLQLAKVVQYGGLPVWVTLRQVQSKSNPDRKPLWLQFAGDGTDEPF